MVWGRSVLLCLMNKRKEEPNKIIDNAVVSSVHVCRIVSPKFQQGDIEIQ